MNGKSLFIHYADMTDSSNLIVFTACAIKPVSDFDTPQVTDPKSSPIYLINFLFSILLILYIPYF